MCCKCCPACCRCGNPGEETNVGSIRQQETGGYIKKNNGVEEWVDDTCFCKCCAHCNYRKGLAIFIFIPVSIVGFLFGVLLYLPGSSVSLTERYDDVICSDGGKCTIVIDVEEDLEAPILFTYELVNFWQSHRVYLNSKSDNQLEGDVLATDGCSPLSKLGEDVIYPCGLLPQSIFTDRFTVDVERGGNTTSLCPTCPTDEAEISWENYWESFDYSETWERTGTWGGLTETKYSTPDTMPESGWTKNSSFLNGTQLLLPDPDDSDMIVWLYTATKEYFKKPHRVIKNFNFLAGDRLHVHVFSYYDPGDAGEKYFHFETTPGFGSSAAFLGTFCLGIGLFNCCMSLYALSPAGHRLLI